jgi:tetratricopeptide (TPR) repeat protein
VSGEHEYPVPPLAEAEAVGFFLQRAQALVPQVSSNGEVIEICRRLDCLPLALELAAARVKLLSPKAILARLEQRLPLLTGGARDAPERQRTLRATIEWSYELLSPTEQRLFARLAVFAGGCTLDAAEEVCQAELDTLSSLVDKSLLRQSGERFRMLETIREYALEWLDLSGEAEEMHRRHTEYFLALARTAEEGLVGADQATWLELLDLEHDNFRGVLSRAESGLQLELAGILWRFWRDRGHFDEGQKRLREILDRAPDNLPLRAKALSGAANLALSRLDLPLTKAYAEEALRLFERVGDTAGIARASSDLGHAALLGGEHERALELYERCRAAALEADDRRNLAGAIASLGNLAVVRGDYEQALALCREGLLLYRELGYPVGVASSLHNLAFAAFRLGRYEEAKTALRESLGLLQELQDRHRIAQSLSLDGSIALAEGRLEEAARLIAMTDALELEIGARGFEPAEQRLHVETASLLRERIPAEELERIRAANGQMTLDKMVAYAVASLN